MISYQGRVGYVVDGDIDASPPTVVRESINFGAVRESRIRFHGSRAAKCAVVFADVVAIAASMCLAAWVRDRIVTRPEPLGPMVKTGVASLLMWPVVFGRYRLYTTAAISSASSEVTRAVHAMAAGVVLTGLISLVLVQAVSRVWLLLLMVLGTLAVLAERGAARRIFRRARGRGKLQRPVIVVGTNAEALGIAQMLGDDPSLGFRVVGLLDCSNAIRAIPPVPVLGHWHDAVEIVKDLDVTGVIIATSAIDTGTANRLARDLIEVGCHVELTSGLVDISADRLLPHPLGTRPVVYVEPIRRFGWRAVAKRVFDLLFAVLLLVLTLPVLIVSAVLIKLDSKGPLFFTQPRLGRDGAIFGVRKLRTMVVGAERMLDELRDQSEVDGPLFKMRNDPRVTRVGRIVRKLSIDELPQLWNVVWGDMSIVGPRPALPAEAELWADETRARLRVKPGITGMWQVSGRSSLAFEDYVRNDLYYVDNWTLLTDLAIVAKTVPVVFLGRGAC
jgi:exopolysaccharide biosynthesis polyprenyl glycosylphosphotransferase